MEHPTDTSEHVAALIAPFLTMNNSAPAIAHWGQDQKHYAGQSCLTMAERCVGRALALYENMKRLDGSLSRVLLRQVASGSPVWSVTTPTSDVDECYYRLHTEYSPWLVKRVRTTAGAGELEEDSPFSVWANLDAKPLFEPATGRSANLVAWNLERYREGKPPMICQPSDDKHIYLLEFAIGSRFTCFRRNAEIHPAALREMVTGYLREKQEWTPEGKWVAAQTDAHHAADPMGEWNDDDATIPLPTSAVGAAGAPGTAADPMGD